MTTNDREELIALYVEALERFRTARRVLQVHGDGTSVPTRAELSAEAAARERMLELRRALWPGWLHTYNHHRHHTALAGPPASRVPNLSGQNS